VTERGGPQLIPRPDTIGAGGPPPWSNLSPEQRELTADDLRRAFTGRVMSNLKTAGLREVLEHLVEQAPSTTA